MPKEIPAAVRVYRATENLRSSVRSFERMRDATAPYVSANEVAAELAIALGHVAEALETVSEDMQATDRSLAAISRDANGGA